MGPFLLRIWVIATLGWWGYGLYFYRAVLPSFPDRSWLKAIEYGVDNTFCNLRISALCRSVSVPFLKRTEMNETFGMALFFLGVPIAGYFVLLMLAWIFRASRKM